MLRQIYLIIQQKQILKILSHVDTSSFSLKTNLANLENEVHKLDIDKLVHVPINLSKLSNVVKNDVVKKDAYDKLVAKVDNIDTSGFVLRTKYNTDKSELENKIHDISGLVKKTDYNAKITDLATKTVLTTIENKIPDVSSLVKKTDYNTKITEIENKLNNHNHDNILLLQNLILQLLTFLMQDQHEQSQCQKQILMLNYQVLTKGLLQIKQNTYLLKMN